MYKYLLQVSEIYLQQKQRRKNCKINIWCILRLTSPKYSEIVENDKRSIGNKTRGLHNNVDINIVIIYKSIGFG